MSTETTETNAEDAEQSSGTDWTPDSADDPDRESSVTVDHGPTTVSSVGALLAAIVAGVTSAPFAIIAIPLAVGGVAMIAGGLFWRANRRWVTIGTVSLYLSPVIAGGFGVPPALLLLSVLASLLAWNFGMHALDLGEQIGRHSRTRRNEVIHLSVITIVGLLSGGVGFAAYTLSGAGQPLAALGMLILGGVFLAWAMRQ